MYKRQIIDFINFENPDILLLQEVDVSSKRTGYIDQVQWLLDNSDSLNYGVYASMWQADFIPSDGLGKVDAGNAILSKWPIEDAERIQLPLRGDQDGLTQYFYLRRNILKSKINISDDEEFYALCTHTTAFATDDTKQKHIDAFYEVLESFGDDEIFVAGGDLNAIPPNATISDFCLLDICNNESFHTVADGPHKEGSYFNNFTGELNLIQPFYENSNFYSAIPQYEKNQSINFTHSTWNTNYESSDLDEDYWDRKLDYIFTNFADGFIVGEGKTHQNVNQLSDHAPVSATLVLP